MKLWVRFALILGFSLLTSSFPAIASCSGLPAVFGTGYNYVHTPGVCPDGAPCPGDSSVTSGLAGSFWATGFGDARPGHGVDNGTWPALEGDPPQQTGWIRFDPNQPAYLWGYWGEDSRQDSCITTQCMALFLSDQGASGGAEGDFALASAHAAPGDPFVFDANLLLAAIPRPVVTSTARLPDGRVSIIFHVDAPTGGLFLDPLCNQSLLVGYRAYHTTTPPGGQPPLRRESWTVVAGGDAPVPFGSSTTIVVDRGCGGWPQFLAATIVTEGGFETAHVSRPRTITLGTPEDVDDDCDGYTTFTLIPELFDCDDGDPHVYPHAPQICDHKNNDCLDPNWPWLTGTNESGPDGDADTWADTCDNCPLDPNPSQADGDHDGVGNACDLTDGLIVLGFAHHDEAVWQQEAGFDTWNVYRGSLDVLRAGGAYTQAVGSNPLAGRTCGIQVASLVDGGEPVSGHAAFYLVTGTAAGVEGDLGTDGAGRPRPNTNPCP